jgi:hypothetical protein
MDCATPNLPSRDFGLTLEFYSRLGFEQSWRDDGWMILSRGGITIEFFPRPNLDPHLNRFSCCLRLDNLGDFCAAVRRAGVPERCAGQPRLRPPQIEESGLMIGYLVDLDGSLLRLIQN